jgi:hypothetical protein
MRQSPSWETNRSTATQEIPSILLNSKIHYRIHKKFTRIIILYTPHILQFFTILLYNY